MSDYIINPPFLLATLFSSAYPASS